MGKIEILYSYSQNIACIYKYITRLHFNFCLLCVRFRIASLQFREKGTYIYYR